MLVTAVSAVAIVLGLLAMNGWLSDKIDEAVNVEQRRRAENIVSDLRAGRNEIPKLNRSHRSSPA